MEEKTADEIAKIFSVAADSVTVINADADFSAYGTRTSDKVTTETEWKDMIKRNVEHLETVKAYTKLDKTTSIWTSEDFTDIDAAITAGKKLY
jgi:methenyltetrahydromethanopterin cyclohydrolase